MRTDSQPCPRLGPAAALIGPSDLALWGHPHQSTMDPAPFVRGAPTAGLGVLCYSPLQSGLLAKEYKDPREVPEGLSVMHPPCAR